MQLYDYTGEKIFPECDENILIDYGRYKGTNYIQLRVYKKKSDGTMQYPFVRRKSPSVSAIDLMNAEGWTLAFNGGVGEGMTIENATVITDANATVQYGGMALTIDQNGDLGYVQEPTAGKGAEYIADGIVSATYGFFPIVENYEAFNYPTNIPQTFDSETWLKAQRQIIGQFGNGDYCIITGEGRSYDGSIGFTIPEAQELCLNLGLKFAFNLDGGGSTQLRYRDKSINTIYDQPTGRKRGAWIVFNGTNQFEIPEP